MIFVVFSFTGVAVMNVSFVSSQQSAQTKQNIINQYQAESTVNQALWRINNGVDSLASFVDGPTISVYDTVNNILTIKVDQFEMEQEISLDLSEDTHFNRALASDEEITTNGYDTGYEEENRERVFPFMPEADLNFFMDNAVEVHNENWKQWNGGSNHEDDEDFAEGIHVFTGSFISLKNMNLNNCTLVFTGIFVGFEHSNVITAPTPIDSADAMPALVFTNPWNWFVVNAEGDHYDKEDKISGAIYTAGTIILKKGELTGPIVGKVISLQAGNNYVNEIDFLDSEFPEYYRWTKGFKDRKHYDWPKQIGRWRHNKWGKKHHHN